MCVCVCHKVSSKMPQGVVRVADESMTKRDSNGTLVRKTSVHGKKKTDNLSETIFTQTKENPVHKITLSL